MHDQAEQQAVPVEPAAVTRTVCRWLEESPGVQSSTRLFAAILLALASFIVDVIVWYVLSHDKPDAGVIAALGGVLGALVLQGVVAISKRGGGE